MDPSQLHTTKPEAEVPPAVEVLPVPAVEVPAVPAVEVPAVPAAVEEPPAVEEPSVVDTGEHIYKFDVKMSCGGCSGAVTRALNNAKPEGISSFEVILEKQEVIVKGTIPFETLTEKIKKTGKEIRSGVIVE